jgi:cell division protein FtsW
MKKSSWSKSKHYLNLFTLPITLSLIGLVFIFESSSVRSFNETGSSFYYFKYQAMWVILGIVVMIIFSFINYHKLYYFAFSCMLLTIFLLVIVLVPGIGHKVGGARRWIDFGFFRLQPTEMAKFSIILYLSSWLVNRERKRFFSFLILVGILMFLIFLQPDMGSALIVFSLSVTIYFLAGIDLIYLFMFLPVSVITFYFLIKLSPYRFNRLLAFFNPSLDPLGITYHINQILISLANGGLFGQGFGVSRQKYMFLPEAHTDSIFAIIGEEVGFVGSFILLFLFLALSYRLFQVTVRTPDRFGRLLAGGIFTFFNLQIIFNLAGVVNLMPLTGVPLPFVSYGGSNLLVTFALIGILINIAKKIH